MTCEVCDLAAIRAAHAYAIEWHTFKGETKEVIDAVPSLLDALVAARAREAALTAEVERLRVEVEVERVGNVWRKMAGDATDLAQDIADEAFGPFETQGPIESLRAIERGIAGLNEDLAAARADAANARAVATEAIDDLSHGVDCDRRRDNDGVVRGCNCYLATLRARLASPEPGADSAKET